jgi:hypothetical protein
MIQLKTLIKPLLALVMAFAVAAPLRAQEGPRGMWPDTPETLSRDALATPYAAALLKQFAANVRKDGDAACLQARGFDDAALVARGRALWQSRGMQMLKLMEQAYDRDAYNAALAAAAGRNAAAELERLRRDRDVRKLIEISRPIKLAGALDHLVEQFDRYVLIARIKLDAVHPVARGEPHFNKDNPTESMRTNPVEETEKARQEFYDKHPSKRIERYLDLVDATVAASPKGFKREELVKLGPMSYFAGADQELAELCVGRRS